MNSSIVSIITPSYNSEKFVEETILSVKNQDYPFIDHIIIDGGSTDGTIAILNKYLHLNWISEKDEGQSDAINKGFGIAKGEIIGWLNSDDTYQPEAISTAINFLKKNTDVDIIYSDVQIIDECGQPVGISRSQSFDIWKLIETNYIRQPTVFIRRRVIKSLKGVDENLHFVMDYELWMRAAMAGFKIQYLPGPPLANFRIGVGTKSFEHAPRFVLEWMYVLEHIFRDSYFDNMDNLIKLRILKITKSQYYFSESIQAIKYKNRRKMLVYFAKAVKENVKIILYLGNWLIIVMGLLGRSVDWRRKFRK
ncbi:MAG: glycosyltransferase [Chloroflexi bacterium]|nr:glycosyltransferase [Chloroflexota bacterium]